MVVREQWKLENGSIRYIEERKLSPLGAGVTFASVEGQEAEKVGHSSHEWTCSPSSVSELVVGGKYCQYTTPSSLLE